MFIPSLVVVVVPVAVSGEPLGSVVSSFFAVLGASWKGPGGGLGGPRRAPEQLWRPLGGVLEAWEHLRGVLVAPGAFAESSWSHLGTLVGPNGSHFGGLLGALFGILF